MLCYLIYVKKYENTFYNIVGVNYIACINFAMRTNYGTRTVFFRGKTDVPSKILFLVFYTTCI